MISYESSFLVSNTHFSLLYSEKSAVFFPEKKSVNLEILDCCFFKISCQENPSVVKGDFGTLKLTRISISNCSTECSGVLIRVTTEDTTEIKSLSLTKSYSSNYANVYIDLGKVTSNYCNSTFHNIKHISFMYIHGYGESKCQYAQSIANHCDDGVELQNQNAQTIMNNLNFVNNTVDTTPEGYSVVRQWQEGSITIDTAYFIGNRLPIIGRAFDPNSSASLGTVTASNIYSDSSSVISISISNLHPYSPAKFAWDKTYWCHYHRSTIFFKKKCLIMTFLFNLVNLSVLFCFLSAASVDRSDMLNKKKLSTF